MTLQPERRATRGRSRSDRPRRHRTDANPWALRASVRMASEGSSVPNAATGAHSRTTGARRRSHEKEDSMGHHRDIYDAANKAWAIGDLEGSLAMYSPDAVLIDPTGEYHGLQAIREHTAEAFVGFSSIENETTNFL